MRNRTFCYPVWVVLILVLAACGDEPPARRHLDRPSLDSAQPGLRIEGAAKGSLTYGDTLTFEVGAASPDHVVQNVTVSLSDTREVLATSQEGIFSIPTLRTGGGNVKLRIDAAFADGQKSMRYKDVKVVAPEKPSLWGLEVVRRLSHDSRSFTQGLLVHQGYLYEGTGNKGESRIRKMELETGKVLMERDNAPDIFGEGITIFGDKLYQLTYKTAQGFVYDLETFEQIDEFTYNTYTGEGWGLTHNDTALIVSDGSAYLHFMDPETLEETARLRVFDDRGDVSRLNELEYRNGTIYANVFTTADIVAIDARTGQVLHRYSARGLVDRSEFSADMDVMNGIAIHPSTGHFLITGKYWKKLYEVRPVMLES